MSLEAKQTMQQRLLLAPNITLALEVLRLPLMEMQGFLQQQAEENPLLEIATSDEPSNEPGTPDTPEPPTPENPPNLESPWERLGSAEEHTEDPTQDDGERFVDQRLVASMSLEESLRLQLGCQVLPPDQRRWGEALINRLNEAGYLDSPLETLAEEWHTTVAQLEPVLKIIQRFDPPGIGARDLRECLMLQLEQRQATAHLAYRIVQEHFLLFTQHRVASLTAATGATPAEVTEALSELKHLNPKPARSFGGQLPPTIVPDLIVHHRERHYDVELNDQELPRVTINRTYYKMLHDRKTPEDVRAFLQGKFRKATWLIKAIDERNATLLAIARCLISLQRGFLDQGPEAIKPLTQAQVAQVVGRHPSTVSRAIASKTIDTPYGIFRLEQLFASSVPQEAHNGGGSISDEHIKAEIVRLTAGEDRQHPLSDEAIAQRLAQRHIVVARRTIAKYRTSLRILPAHLRRRLQ
jgi:RNA polymerase sigma-54 factor